MEGAHALYFFCFILFELKWINEESYDIEGIWLYGQYALFLLDAVLFYRDDVSKNLYSTDLLGTMYNIYYMDQHTRQ